MQSFTAIRSFVFKYPKTITVVTVTGKLCTQLIFGRINVVLNRAALTVQSVCVIHSPMPVIDMDTAVYWLLME